MSQDFKVHQFHYGATLGDAVTNHMLLIQNVLKNASIQGSIFSIERKNISDTKVLPFKKEKIWDCDLLLIHHSHGNPQLQDVLGLEIPKALIYHNVTPHKFFPHDPHIEELCRLGTVQLKEFKNHVVTAFAVSKYNAEELNDLGFKDVQILPLLDLSGLPIEKKEPLVVQHSEPKNLVFVGRLSPHKNQRLLIETFFYLKEKLPRHSRLTLVGNGDPVYTRYLKLLVRQLGLSQSVQFTGKVTEKELDHLYESADAFISCSLHEGFCIPLVEAMQKQLPVFYLGEAAIPETMGKSGMCFQTKSPVALSEVLAYALSDEEILNEMLESQNHRLQELKTLQTPEGIQAKILSLLPRLENRYLHESRPVEQHADL